MSVQILDNESCQRRVMRIAYQLYEFAFEQKAITLLGIDVRGAYLANLLAKHLRQISPLQVRMLRVDRGAGLTLNAQQKQEMTTAPLILVDDVLYTGTTLMHTLADVRQYAPPSIHIAVLIDRGHHLFPLRADFVGRELATTLQEYITVTVNEETGEIAAYLD